MTAHHAADPRAWPELPLDAWNDTYATLHRWMQVVGKVRLAASPWVNHSWHATLYVTARGLTTSPIPAPDRTFQIDFDFLDHRLVGQCSDGSARSFPLQAEPVAEFHRRLIGMLRELGLPAKIHPRPNELPDATPFAEDLERRSYDPEYAWRFWRILDQSARVLQRARETFVGKCSPVHVFWGAADLAMTRFSGRTAPEHPGGVPNLPDWVVREAYSHEVMSCGFWPGGGVIEYPAFYAYAYPEPAGFAEAAIDPAEAFYSTALGEYILPYDAVRTSADPEATLLSFLQSTYSAAADLGGWDRASLERVPPAAATQPISGGR